MTNTNLGIHKLRSGVVQVEQNYTPNFEWVIKFG